MIDCAWSQASPGHAVVAATLNDISGGGCRCRCRRAGGRGG